MIFDSNKFNILFIPPESCLKVRMMWRFMIRYIRLMIM